MRGSLLAGLCIFLPCSILHAEQTDFSMWQIAAKGNDNYHENSVHPTVALRKVNGKWTIDENARPWSPENQIETILLCQSCQPSTVVVMASLNRANPPDMCAKGPISSSLNPEGYNVCTSSLFKCSTKISHALLGWPLLFAGIVACKAEIDTEATLSAIQEAGVATWLDSRIVADHYRVYVNAFKGIKNPEDAAKFIETYKDDDTDKLVPHARGKIDNLLESARMAREENQRRQAEAERSKEVAEKRRVEELQEVERQREIADKLRIADDKQRFANHKSSTLTYRKHLAVGDDSHCGMIIEIKLPLVKVQTMTGEKWFRLNQTYPPGSAPCRFVNNVYQQVDRGYEVN